MICFWMQGAFCVLHEGLNVLSHIADCILSRHLNLLLKSPSATDLIMHFISAHPKHMARLYGRMYELLIQGEIKEDLLRQSTCSRHMLRDIRALLPTSEGKSFEFMSSCCSLLSLKAELWKFFLYSDMGQSSQSNLRLLLTSYWTLAANFP